MTETVKSRVYDREFLIGKKYAQGGMGSIWETDDPRVLVKQCEPELVTDDPGRQQVLSEKAERAYKAFCAVNKGRQLELSSLPREYVTVGGNPAYLMQRAEGVLLQSLLREKRIAAVQRLPLAQALARALGKLHHAQIIHADSHPENYMVSAGPGGFRVIVLDIDGGGLVSPPGPLYPMTQPKRLYKAPELSQMTWERVYKRHLFFAPDDWALGVLLYQILVDYEGPFCTVKHHPNPSVKNYTPYMTAAYRDRSIAWPMPWQKQLLQGAGLPEQVVSLFYKTFAHRFILDEKKGMRPTAEQWEKALAPQAFSPLNSLYRLQTVAAPLKSAVAGTVLPEGRCEDTVRVCVHDAPPLPNRWRKAKTLIVRILHLNRGVSGNGRRRANAA
jgi:serine/threonine protein kinase